MKRMMAVLVLLSLVLLPTRGLALSCVEPPPPDLAFEEYDGVVIGTVTGIREGNRERMLMVDVETSFKGVDKEIIVVEEDAEWGRSRLNAEYLYYLREEGGDWVHPLCSPTTQDTAIAEEYYGDKEEIPLEDVDPADLHTAGIQSEGMLFFGSVAVFFTMIAVGFLVFKRKKT
ncbi:hypothetical protein [Indiicoccus explosivorum]|uniref:hypothetical protein n=1 Tax=Indiicoccus explosivorum TaxID=1917864 RepID=UPI000B43C592|nr:hypothetical protein [Indiicoccus explosivorum]